MDKRQAAMEMSNLFYFAAPAGMIRPEDLPPCCGLKEYRDGKLNTACQATFRDRQSPEWRFVASLCRRIMQAQELPTYTSVPPSCLDGLGLDEQLSCPDAGRCEIAVCCYRADKRPGSRRAGQGCGTFARRPQPQMMKGADTMSKLTRAEWHRIVNRAYEKAGKCPPDCPGRCPDTWLTGDGVGCLDEHGRCILISVGNGNWKQRLRDCNHPRNQRKQMPS